jgi:hypothetical protein
MSRYIPENIRELVSRRADFRCEYCRFPADRSFFTFHIDHIVSVKHGGKTVSENLAFCCPVCNLSKGSDVATLLGTPPVAVRLFNPRTDFWADHFSVDASGLLLTETDIGQATIKILNLNHPDFIIERREMLRMGLL